MNLLSGAMEVIAAGIIFYEICIQLNDWFVAFCLNLELVWIIWKPKLKEHTAKIQIYGKFSRQERPVRMTII